MVRWDVRDFLIQSHHYFQERVQLEVRPQELRLVLGLVGLV